MLVSLDSLIKEYNSFLPNQICLLLLALMTLGRRTLVGEGQWQFPLKSSRDHLIAAQLAAQRQDADNREVTPLPVWVVSCFVSAFVSLSAEQVFVSLSSPFTRLFPAISCAICKLLHGFVRRSQVQKLL